MMRGIIPGLCLLIVSCAAPHPVTEFGEFERYVAVFEHKSMMEGKPHYVDNLIIEFGPMDPPTVGICMTGGSINPTIHIKKEYWDVISETSRLNLMLHEMGHCVLDRDHNITMISGRPMSIMYPNMFPDIFYHNYNWAYDHELFWGN